MPATITPTIQPTYSGTAYPYDPNYAVVSVSGIAHVDPYSHQIIDEGFGKPDFHSYLLSLVTVPVSIASSFLLAVIIYFLLANCGPGTIYARKCWRYVCCLFLCCPEQNLEVTSDEAAAKKEWYDGKQLFWQRFSYFTLFVLFISDCFIFLGNQNFTSGFHSFLDSTDTVTNFVTEVVNDCSQLVSYSASFTNTINTVSCSGSATYIPDDVYNTLNGVEISITSLLNPVSSLSDSMHSFVQVAVDQKDSVVIAFFLCFLITIILYVVVCYKKSKLGIYPLNFLSYSFILASLILCTVVMIICMLVGDFCMDPAGNTVNGLGPSLKSTLEFYIYCVGVNPFADDMASIQAQINEIGTSLNTIQANNACYDALLADYNGMTSSFDLLSEDLLSCHHMNQFFHDLVESSLCTFFFTGAYQSFCLIYFMALFLFVLLISTSRLYTYMLNFEDSPHAVKVVESQHLGGGKVTISLASSTTGSGSGSSSSSNFTTTNPMGGSSRSSNLELRSLSQGTTLAHSGTSPYAANNNNNNNDDNINNTDL